MADVNSSPASSGRSSQSSVSSNGERVSDSQRRRNKLLKKTKTASELNKIYGDVISGFLDLSVSSPNQTAIVEIKAARVSSTGGSTPPRLEFSGPEKQFVPPEKKCSPPEKKIRPEKTPSSRKLSLNKDKASSLRSPKRTHNQIKLFSVDSSSQASEGLKMKVKVLEDEEGMTQTASVKKARPSLVKSEYKL